ncbi:hypothetical protein AIOL_003044 [Candidatus Rhodobacter oscarellae]|uniref:Uncharacterized protein n=1 Tax=Candidatus Rhodobacter oscarellae TaxID=1675527 RepID=A0A0J9E8P9_9RHOB|nr:hypothetical protein AIOL_003044 [Candidatus Rhodobacter lobularis]
MGAGWCLKRAFSLKGGACKRAPYRVHFEHCATRAAADLEVACASVLSCERSLTAPAFQWVATLPKRPPGGMRSFSATGSSE